MDEGSGSDDLGPFYWGGFIVEVHMAIATAASILGITLKIYDISMDKLSLIAMDSSSKR